MKKTAILLTLLAGSLGMTASAFSPGRGSEAMKSREDRPKPTKNYDPTIEVNGKSYKIRATAAPVAATRTSEEESIITEAQGDEKYYNKASAGTFLFFGELNLYKEPAFPASVVWGENNEVYVKDILSTFMCDSYIKGTQTGDEVVFPTGQIIDYVIEDPYEYGVAIGIYKIEENLATDTYDFIFDPDITEFTIKVSNKGQLDLVLPGKQFNYNSDDLPEYAVGIYATDDGMFMGFCDFYQRYTPTQFETIRMPIGVPAEDYVFVDEFDFADIVSVAYTDTYIYIKGLDPLVPEGVIRAKINGNKAVVAQNEYVGIYMGMSYIFTKVWFDNPEYDEMDPMSMPYIMADPSVGFELTFNREEGWIAAETPGVYLSFQPNENSFANSNCFLTQFVMRYQKEQSGVPANPSRLNYYVNPNIVTAYGYADFQFNVSNYSTQGALLDVDYLYYRVFINGEPLIFRNEMVTGLTGYLVEAYPEVPGEQMWMPFTFSNDEDIFKYFPNGNEFDIGIYEAEVETLGVQSMYYHPDYPLTYSEIVTLDVATGEITTAPSGVERVTVAPVESTEYYNLSGIKVAKPGKGIYIQKNHHSDGKVTTNKVIMH